MSPPWCASLMSYFTSVFGRLLFQHYDLIIGLLLVAVTYLALRKKNRCG